MSAFVSLTRLLPFFSLINEPFATCLDPQFKPVQKQVSTSSKKQICGNCCILLVEKNFNLQNILNDNMYKGLDILLNLHNYKTTVNFLMK